MNFPSAQPDPFDSFSIAQWPKWKLPKDNSELIAIESCDDWTAAGVNSPTVSLTLLTIPNEARKKYKDGCRSFKDKQFPQAERSMQQAVAAYPKYAVAWVTLGHVLTSEHKPDQAHKACEQALQADPRYTPGYVCLADLAAAANNWGDVLAYTNQALSLDPATNMYAFFYAAAADFHLQHLPEAEVNGRSAENLDTWHRMPQVHLLLAHIYGSKGDSRAEVNELRLFLKQSSKSEESNAARTTLAELGAKTAR
jgi:tetratricopeptide (TPR) repeat protein